MKKTEVITIRVSEELKEKIKKRADHYKWSTSQTIEQILQAYFSKAENNMEDLQTETLKISKSNMNTLYYVAKNKRLTEDETINYIIDFFSALWPIEDRQERR